MFKPLIIALFANTKKKQSHTVALDIARFLRERHVHVVARDSEAQALSIPPLSSVDPQNIDCLIALGGDGTILRLVHHFPHLTAPILGINLGQLGFMTEITLNDLYPSLEDVIAGHYRIEERLMMEGETSSQEKCFAVNEIVFHRSRHPTLIDLAIYVDGLYLNTFSADGIIISTPGGSTAYSLAAGGPILTPLLQAFVLTPICPHTISNRAIVFMPKEKIEVEYLSSYDPIEITYDGFSNYTLHPQEKFTIRASDRPFKMLNLKRIDYYSTLRTKLGWSGQVRYSQLNHRDE